MMRPSVDWLSKTFGVHAVAKSVICKLITEDQWLVRSTMPSS